jgi:hypothetical protein
MFLVFLILIVSTIGIVSSVRVDNVDVAAISFLHVLPFGVLFVRHFFVSPKYLRVYIVQWPKSR